MNKSKILVSLFLVLLICIIPLGYTNAASIDLNSLDPKSLIMMPSLIFNGSATIDVSTTVTDYTLFYQPILLTESESTNIKNAMDNIKEKEEEFSNSLDSLKVELDNLEEEYNSASTAYEEGLNNEELSQEDLETLKTSYETAKTNYENKRTEYNNKVDEYKQEIKELFSQLSSLIPDFDEQNWTKTEDGNIEIDLNQFSGERDLVVWAKLVTSEDTYYDMNIYTMNGSKDPSTEVSGISLNMTNMSLAKGVTLTLTATVSPSTATDKTVIWKSDDENIATVVDGKVTGKSVGTTAITATTKDGNYSATCKVTVIEADDDKNEDSDNNNNNNNNKDDTTATGKLPQTGVSNVIIFSILGISILGIIAYKAYKYFNF